MINEAALTAELKGLRTDAQLPGSEDVEAMNNRVRAMEILYLLCRRDDPASTMHGKLTGLWDQMREPQPVSQEDSAAPSSSDQP